MVCVFVSRIAIIYPVFFAYEVFVLLPKVGVEFEIFGTVFAAETRWLTRASLGALLVLFFNTAAYSAEIFYGALKSIPVGETEAADSFGMSGAQKFTALCGQPCCDWLAVLYNEAIFCFMPPRLCFFQVFRHGGKKVMRFIMQTTLPTRHLIHSFPIRFWLAILFW